jgi:hypothetical protein
MYYCSWFFHSRNDTTVRCEDTIRLVDALRKEHAALARHARSGSTASFPASPLVRVTIFEPQSIEYTNVGSPDCTSPASPTSEEGFVSIVSPAVAPTKEVDEHECWDRVYCNETELWEWMFNQ